MTPFSTWYQKSQKYQLVLMGLRNLRRRDGGGKGEAPPRFKSVPKVPKPFKVGRDRFGTKLLLYCYAFHKRKEASMNESQPSGWLTMRTASHSIVNIGAYYEQSSTTTRKAWRQGQEQGKDQCKQNQCTTILGCR